MPLNVGDVVRTREENHPHGRSSAGTMRLLPQLRVGVRVHINNSVPELNLHHGVITAITKPFVADEPSREYAFRELRLYEVLLEDGRYVRCRGKELLPLEVPASMAGQTSGAA